MNESTQTLWFLGAAVAAVALAFVTLPSDATYQVDELVGQALGRAFEAEEAKSLRIVRFDDETATLRDFEVAEQGGVWSLPSKGGYPADAERQMGQATAGVMDREILQVISQSAADHDRYGVVDPLGNLDVGSTGVGTRVTLAGDDGSPLVDLVVGKEVKDAEGQHYVRRATQDVVFVTEIDTDSLSTDFEDWIEDDLLKLSSFDIQSVRIRDYTAELVPQGFRIGIALEPRSDMTLEYDGDESEWRPVELLEWSQDAKDYAPFELAESETLNDDSLRELRSALDDLTIVDVDKKPAGLSADLRAGEDFFENQESTLDLMSRGFAPTSEGEILSTEGEVVCTLKTGVEYVLRFGNLQTTLAGDEDAADAAEGEGAGEDDGESVNRYLFVMARFNESAVEPPELEEVPEEPAEAPAAEDEAAEEATEESEPAEEADDRTKELEELVAERKRIEESNQRKQQEYESKLQQGRGRVTELNDRFGDWYYVVSNDVYKKIRLGREDVIEEEEPEEGEETADEPADATTPGVPLPGLPDLSGLTDEPPADEAAESNSEAAPAETE